MLASVFVARDLLSTDLFSAEFEVGIGLAPLGAEELFVAAGAGDGAFVVDADCVIGGMAGAASA